MAYMRHLVARWYRVTYLLLRLLGSSLLLLLLLLLRLPVVLVSLRLLLW